MCTYNAHAVDEEGGCTQSTIVASVVSSIITAIVGLVVLIVIHAGVCFYRKSRSNRAVCQVCQKKSNDDVYEMVDDKAGTVMCMTTNEAYGTNKH